MVGVVGWIVRGLVQAGELTPGAVLMPARQGRQIASTAVLGAPQLQSRLCAGAMRVLVEEPWEDRVGAASGPHRAVRGGAVVE